MVRLCLSSLRVGVLGFGGPLATMSMMRDEIVAREKLVDDSRYLEGLGVVKMLPGPVSVLLIVFLGQEVAGTIGGILASMLYILPSFLLMLGIAVLEDQLAPYVGPVKSELLGALKGLTIVVIGIILQTCWKLFSDAFNRDYKTSMAKMKVAAFVILSGILVLLGLHELLILLTCAVFGYLLWRWGKVESQFNVAPLVILGVFFTAGLTVFGTGYMVLPHLDRVLVGQNHWITPQEFLTSVAYGNLTPGPILIASSYMGFKMNGYLGSVIATFGIFAGPIMLMLMLGPLVRKALKGAWTSGVLMGLLPAVATTIALSLRSFTKGIEWTPVAIALVAVSFVLTVRKVPAWATMLGAAVIGAFLFI